MRARSCIGPDHDGVAFPRALKLVRDTAAIGDIPRALTAESVPHVRDASAQLLDLIQRNNGQSVSKSTALQVPAFSRALGVYFLISSLPLREYIREDVTTPRAFLRQPSRITTYTALISRTLTDLLMYDEAYWKVTERTWDGFPAAIIQMPYDQISYVPNPTTYAAMLEIPADGTVYWNGNPVPPRDVIRFDGFGLGGWLSTGVQVLNTAAALEAAALRAAEIPAPSIVLKNTGADLPASQVDALLEAWETARTSRSTAYLNSTLETASIGGWSPSDLQLSDARAAASAQVARLCNLDPVWVGASVPGSSLTYQNRQDLMRQLLDVSLGPVMRLVTERLSMDDVTPRGHVVEFETEALLKANTTELAQLIAQMQPLGVISIDEARRMLDIVEMGDQQ